MMLPDEIREILSKLEAAGFEAYIVGGCVRDGFLGLPVHDFDVTTSALPSETADVFKDCRVIETGIKHGTVTVLYKGLSVEITTFRVDGEYIDSRHPESVEFSSRISDDLSRRDFTMNAAAFNPKTGVVDPFGGRKDIENKIIRCVGEPKKRFSEDALRIIRALRFAATLGFDIENETKKAIFELKNEINKVSRERITAELKRLLCGDYVKKILLEYAEIFGVMIPQIAVEINFDQGSKWHNSTLFEHSARAVAAAEPIPELRLAMLLHDIGKPSSRTVDSNGECHYYGHAAAGVEIADEVLRELKCDNRTRETVCAIIKYHDMPVEASEKFVKRQLSRRGYELFQLILMAHIADDSAKIPEAEQRIPIMISALEIASRLERENAALSLRDLAINGTDLRSIMKPSPKMGEILEKLLEEVLDEEVENEKTALLRRAGELLESEKT